MSQFKEVNGQQQLKHLCSKVQEMILKVSITKKKRKTIFQTNYMHINQGEQGSFHLPANFAPDIDFTDEPLVHFHVAAVKKYVCR